MVTFVEFLYGLTRAASNGQAYGDTLRDELEDTVWPESKKKVYGKDSSGQLFHFLDKVAVYDNVSGKTFQRHGQLVYALNNAYLLDMARARQAGEKLGQHSWMHLKSVFDQLDDKDNADVEAMSSTEVVNFVQELQTADEHQRRQEAKSAKILRADEDQTHNRSKGSKEFVAMLGEYRPISVIRSGNFTLP